MKSFGFLVAFAAFLSLWFVPRSHAETRVALIVGNSAYAHAPALQNPTNDAVDMAGALRELGFQVVEAADVDKATLEADLRQFVEMADGADVALLFYAGHGIQVDGRNFLIPVDAKLARRASLDFELVDVDRVAAALQNAARATLIILDACRDNPFAQTLVAADRGIPPRGLAPVETSGSGLLLALSTAPGKVAADGGGRNSPFTSALLRHIRTPDIDVTTVLTRVRNDVAQATHDAQIPWVTMSLRDQIYLAPRAAPAAAPAKREPSPCEKRVDPSASAAAALVADIDAGLRACAEELNIHPEDAGLVERLQAAKEQRAFKNSMVSNSTEASETYLILYPSGRYVDEVRVRVAELAPPPRVAATVPAEPRRDHARDTKALVERYWDITNDVTQRGSALQPFYADSVTFYGDRKSKGEIIRLKIAYFEDWSDRDYRASRASVSCDNALCREEGVVDWRVVSQSRKVVSSGSSTFTFIVDWSSGDGKIVSETGAVLNRQAHKL